MKNEKKLTEGIDEQELRVRVQKRMEQMNAYWSTQYDYSSEMLEFCSGEQWDEEVEKERIVDGRPSLVLNLTKTYANRIVNPLRLDPMGIKVTVPNEDISELITGIVRDIEVKSRASQAYENAYEQAVIGGVGWVRVCTDYDDDESLEQKIRIDIISNPLSVFIDPNSELPDASDAKFGCIVTYIDKDEAEEEYGEEAVAGNVGGVNLYNDWMIPENSVCDMTYYELKEDKKPRYWYADGSTSDEAVEGVPYVAKRLITQKVVHIIRWVGNALVEHSTLPIPYIPLVPVFGDRLYTDDVKYCGIVHWIKDSQRLVNFYASNELELASLAPKSPWVIAEGQIEGYEEEWGNANNKTYSALPYVPVSLNGTPVPPPTRADNQPQTAPLMASRAQAQQDMGRELGIFDNLLGGMEGANESGKSVLLRQNQGEMATAHYLDNLQQSISQIGRIVVWMLPYAYDTERPVAVRDAKGERTMVNMRLKDVITPEILKNLDIETESGPAYQGRRREAVGAILQIAQVMPDKMAIMADLLVRNLDVPGAKEIADRLEMTLPPELKQGESQIPPEIQQQMMQKEQTIQQQNDQLVYLQNVISQLQMRLMNDDKARQADMAKTIINNEAKLAVERIKQSGDNDRQTNEIQADYETEMAKINAEYQKSIAKLNSDVTKARQPQVKMDIQLNRQVDPMADVNYSSGMIGPLRTDIADYIPDNSNNL